jgi:hypothetical protein
LERLHEGLKGFSRLLVVGELSLNEGTKLGHLLCLRLVKRKKTHGEFRERGWIRKRAKALGEIKQCMYTVQGHHTWTANSAVGY